MISHEHQCIFVHIQRTAGTSIEQWLTGLDWWAEESETKHMTAHQTKVLYQDWWDSYFKFSIVRDPWARLVSLAKFRNSGVTQQEDGMLDLDGYLCAVGNPPVEYDQRFSQREEVARETHKPGALYSNTLDEQLDFVGSFEALPAAIDVIRDGITDPPSAELPHMEQANKRRLPHLQYYTEQSWLAVHDLHACELEILGYTGVEI